MNKEPILRVRIGIEDSKRLYDNISKYYDIFGFIENKPKTKALEMAQIKEGEKVLEIGFGTGWGLLSIAKSVGEKGKVCGIDISKGMLRITQTRLKKAGLLPRVELVLGDARNMPYDNNFFDVVFITFTLELFDTPDIPKVLSEIKRVLKPGGRAAVTSMSKKASGLGRYFIRLYEWAHKKFPYSMDCRPIYAEESIKEADFKNIKTKTMKLFGLPVEIVCGVKEK